MDRLIYTVKTRSVLIISGVFFLLFWLKSLNTIDPDFWWHLTLGKQILAAGIPYKDIFSYTMPSYPLIASEWLSEILFYLVFNSVSAVGLSLIVSGICILTVALQFVSLPKSMHTLTVIPLLLACSVLLSFVTMRPQVFTWLCFSLLIQFIQHRRYRHLWPLLPVMFLLWTNLHGGFAAGVCILILWFITLCCKRRKIELWTAWLLFGCILATLFNPYGVRIWHEILLTVTSHSLRESIAEWMPAVRFANYIFWVYFILAIVFIVRLRKSLEPGYIVAFVAVTFLALSGIKHIPLLIIMGVMPITTGLHQLRSEAGDVLYGEERFLKIHTVLSIVLLLLVLPILLQNYRIMQYQKNFFYPTEAIMFLAHKPFRGNIFSTMEWNSYIRWHLPDKKVFLNGMMPVWQQKKAGESNSALHEYQSLVNGSVSVDSVRKKYHITHFLLPTQEAYYSSLRTRLEKNYWKAIYRDAKAIIYTPE